MRFNGNYTESKPIKATTRRIIVGEALLSVVMLIMFLLIGVLSALPVAAAEKKVAVLLSREILPYISMVKGFEEELKLAGTQRFFLDDKGRVYSLSGTEGDLVPQQYAALVAVGPEALSWLLPRTEDVPLLYGMVLDPSEFISLADTTSRGVSLKLPISVQLSILGRHLPPNPRVGVLFDPDNNQAWFDAALEQAPVDMKLIALRVSADSGRLQIFADFSGLDAILFIPDRTIISRAVIRYVIKQSFLHRVPVVGYNQFFIDAGAAYSFIIDYHGIGKQVAALATEALSGRSGQSVEPPVFRFVTNQDVVSALGLSRERGKP